MSKIIYYLLLYVAISNETLDYSNLVFLPELASIGFLTCAYVSELVVLIINEHQVTSSVRRIGVVRYLKDLKNKKRIMIIYFVVLGIMYTCMTIAALQFNREEVSKTNEDKHNLNEIERTLFMSGYSAIAAMISFPLIAILYSVKVHDANKNLLSKR